MNSNNTEKESTTIEDFIYMDTERLKLIVAQLNQGLIEGTSKTVTDTDVGKINAGVDFLKIWACQEKCVSIQNTLTHVH